MKLIPFNFSNIKNKSERVRFTHNQHIFNIEVEYIPFRSFLNNIQGHEFKKDKGLFYINFYNEKGEDIILGKCISHNVDLSLEYKRVLNINLDSFKIFCIPKSYEAEKIGKVTFDLLLSGDSVLVVK